MLKSFRKTFVPAILAGAAALTPTSAQAVRFNLIDTGGTGQFTQARIGFEAAAFYWSSVFTDDVTVNLRIGFEQLAPNVLGSAQSTTSINFTSQVYGALLNDITSTGDISGVSNLNPLRPSLNFGEVSNLVMTTNALNATGTGYLDTATRVDNNDSGNNNALGVNTSVDKALGITTDLFGNAIDPNAADGTIRFSNQFAFDFDPRDGITAGSFDFVGVAIHEIGHVLGFRSGVDTYDAFTAPGSANTRTGALENIALGTVFDLYRYSAEGRLDWSTQNTPFFSITGGASQVFGNSLLSTGVRNGDGRQASHHKDAAAGQPQLGVLDPTSGRGQEQEVTALDLVAFDVIGWDVNFDPLQNPNYRRGSGDIFREFRIAAGIPEPATWGMMILGVGMVGGAMRQRRRAKVSFAA